jgi:hypothetical protein
MIFFKKKPQDPTMIVQPPEASRVEVELDKVATDDAARKAHATNKHLTELLVNNGFTLKIYMAAGHQYPPTKKGNKRK